MTITMYDSVAEQFPETPDAFAGYTDGAWGNNFAQLRAKYPSAIGKTITVTGTAGADICDCEQGDLTPQQAALWAANEVNNGRRPTIYSSSWTKASISYNLSYYGLTLGTSGQVDWWEAHYDGVRSISPGAIGKQYLGYPGNSPGQYDESVVLQSWATGVVPTPSPAPQEGPTMAITKQYSFRSGQVDVFQASAGTIWHKWCDLSTGQWNNESIPGVLGITGVTFTGDEPRVDTGSRPGCIVVTAEDTTGKGWYFLQGPTGSWNVNELP